jgi:CMP-N,N'-diacetyllegionaminic acid synthase
MNILFTVCCRAGSKGLKNKNLLTFLGMPLVYYTLASIRLYSEFFGRTDTIRLCLNTDSEDLIEQVMAFESEVFVIRRDKSLAGDTVSKLAVVKDCLQRAESESGLQYDVVVDLDVTSPLRRLADIRAAIITKHEQQDVDVVFSVTNARRNPYFNMVKINPDGTVGKVLESGYTARQQAPEMFDMNASIYAYGTEYLRGNDSNLLFDGRCDIVIMPDTGVLDIDSEDDFVLMEAIGEFLFKNDRDYGEIAQAARV